MAAKLEKTQTPGIYKRGTRYVLVWLHEGVQHREAFRTLDDAREAKGSRKAVDSTPKKRVRFGVYFEKWIETYAGRTDRGFSETTRPEYRRPIEAEAMPYWATLMISDVTPKKVRELFGAMRTAGKSTSAIKKLRAALSAMFATAVDDDLITSNPVQGIRIPAAPEQDLPDDDQLTDERAKALTREELKILVAAIPEGWRLFFEFLAHTGLRISEATGLRWEHVDLGDRPHIKVREQFYRGKRRKLKSADARRDIPLSQGMTTRLLAHRRDNYRGPKAPLFPSKTGTPLIRGKVADRVLNPARKAVGMEWVSFHAFRHTCASLLFDEGRNIKQVSEWLGHADPAFTLRTYVHLLDEGVGGADFLDEAVQGDNGVTTNHPETAANQDGVKVHELA